MGRHPNPPQADASGYYWSRHPGLKKRVNLGTKVYVDAVRLQQSFYSVDGASAPTDPGVSNGQPQNVVASLARMGSGTGMPLSLDDEIEKPKSPVDLLTQWANKQPDPTPVQAELVPPPPVAPQTTSTEVVPVKRGGRPPKKQLSPEATAKISSAIKKTVVNLNVVLVGASVQMFGRQPAELDKEEVELLQVGWEMWLEDILQKSKLQPWHLVALGNILIASSMWVGGKPNKQPSMKVDSTKAKGTESNVVSMTPPKGTGL